MKFIQDNQGPLALIILATIIGYFLGNTLKGFLAGMGITMFATLVLVTFPNNKR